MGYFAPLRSIPYETRFDLRFHERKEVKTLEQEKFVENMFPIVEGTVYERN